MIGEDVSKIREAATKKGLTEKQLSSILGNEVHAAKGREAASINNDGIEAQVEYLGLLDVIEIIDSYEP